MNGYRPLWDEGTPFPAHESLRFADGAADVMVHRAGADGYGFLHDAAIIHHDGGLFAAWYNCPDGEIEGESLIRGRTSLDGGLSWSDPEVVASDAQGAGIFYVPVALLSHGGVLHAYVANMIGHDLVTACEVFVADETETSRRWKSRGHVAGPFLPNSSPARMPDGCFIVGGRMADDPGGKPLTPAVALSDGSNLTAPWTTVPLPCPLELPYPETALVVDQDEILALVRNDHGSPLLFVSSDCGRAWSGPLDHNFPMGASKMCGGMLSTGQRYIIANMPTDGYRDLLVIATSRPRESVFSTMWKVRDGFAESLDAGPEWSYPSAIEWNGHLYIVYTSEKRHCVMTVIPVAALAGD
jgi:BNR repeat-like domain